jgi:hypothetical protein
MHTLQFAATSSMALWEVEVVTAVPTFGGVGAVRALVSS